MKARKVSHSVLGFCHAAEKTVKDRIQINFVSKFQAA